MTKIYTFAASLVASAFAGVDAANAANILTIDFDANAGYAYGFNEFYGYGSPNSAGNQAEGAWGATPTTPFSDSADELAGVGVGASDGLRATMDSSGLVTAALEDANIRFGDNALSYSYWGGSFGTGADPAAITTIDLSEIVFSIEADFVGAESAGSLFRVSAQFQGGATPDVLFQYDFPIDPFATGYNTYTAPLSDFTVTSGSAADIAQDFTNLNVNLQAQSANNGFGYDDNNVITVDNVSIEQIPEPGTLGLMGICAAFFALRRRRAA